MKIQPNSKFLHGEWFKSFKSHLGRFTNDTNVDINFIKKTYASRMGSNRAAWDYYVVYCHNKNLL